MRPAYPGNEVKTRGPSPSGNRWRKFACCISAISLMMASYAFAQTALPEASRLQLDFAPAKTMSLPDSPGAVWAEESVQQIESQKSASQQPSGQQPSGQQSAGQPPASQTQPSHQPAPLPPCPTPTRRIFFLSLKRDPCDPYQPFIERAVNPLSPTEKGYLAIHDVTDPFNLLTIVATSAFTIGSDSYTAFGPGMRGFGLNIGTSLSQDVTGELIGTFGACSLLHQDPRYFRMPGHKPLRRLLHAISQVIIAQGDNGRPMPNYSNFINAAAASEMANLYVPGIATDQASTTERILTGFLTEPIGNIVAEFLPDIASRIHIRVVLVQRLLNQISVQPSRTGIPGDNPF